MPFVDDEALVRRKYRGLAPVPRHASHGEVGQEQMMVDDDDVCLRRLTACLEEKALREHRTCGALTEIRLRGDFVPQLGARRGSHVAQRAVFRSLGPCTKCV